MAKKVLRNFLNLSAITGLFISMICIFGATALSAESIFLKNGAIIEGKIVKDTDKTTVVKTAEGNKQTISRSDILRTIYNEDYKEKRFLNQMDGTSIEVYIVDEDDISYTYRADISSSRETVIKKSDVESISKLKRDKGLEFWDRGYITASAGYIYPAGILNSLTNYGIGATLGYQYFFIPSFDASFRLYGSYIRGKFDQAKDDLEKTQTRDMKILQGCVLGGYTLQIIKERLNAHAYAGGGYGLVDVNYTKGLGETEEKFYWHPVIIGGIEFPIRLLSTNMYIAPFVEYINLPSMNEHIGMVKGGIRYAF